MPPESPIPKDELLLPPAHKSGAGPLVGVIIIVGLLIVGALYFWGAHLNAQQNPENQLPLIPSADSSATVTSTTTTY